MGDIRLFVSHAHKDKEIAAALVTVIEAMMVPRPLIATHNLRLRTPHPVKLRSLLSPDILHLIMDRGSPFYKIHVLSVEGAFLPGHAGAPAS